MREPPPDVDERELLAIVRRMWCEGVDRLEHLPVGFGAHHWTAYADGEPTLFVTWDELLPRHPGTELEDAYATAAHLASGGLDFVIASLPASGGRFTVAMAERAVSATRWRDGRSGDGTFRREGEVVETAEMLTRLHAAEPLDRTPRWRPLVRATFAEEIARGVRSPWRTGPYGDVARTALTEHLDPIKEWTARYLELADTAESDADRWVITHGEPHTANHLVTSKGRFLVDWESTKVAPRERDLRPLIDSGMTWSSAYGGQPPTAEMLEMFDLEWRLDEVGQYAAWFAAPHSGSASDKIAISGLLEELNRPDWSLGSAPD